MAKLSVRLTDELHAVLKKRAASHHRTLQGELLEIVEQFLLQEQPVKPSLDGFHEAMQNEIHLARLNAQHRTQPSS